MNRARVVRWVVRGATATGAFVLLLWFSTAHYGQRVTLHLWILTLRDVPLPFALYGAAIVGMAFILLIGLRTDLETRRMLQRYRAIAELDRVARRVRDGESQPAPESEGAKSPGGRGDESGAGGGTGGGAERSRLEDVPQSAGPD